MTGRGKDDLSDLDRLRRITSQPFRDQAIWFLNASEASNDESQCELTWDLHKKAEELSDGGGDGTCLDELNAHRLLEYAEKACTNKEMRAFLANIDPNYKGVSLAELLIINFGGDWVEMVNAPQCYDWRAEKEARDGMERARRTLETAVDAAEKASLDAETSREAEETAAREQEESSKAMEASRIAEAASSDAKEQAKLALDALRAQEDSIVEKTARLEKLSSDEGAGIVKRNKAKAELAILRGEDSLPLRSAKLRQEAAVKRLTKAIEAARRAGEAAGVAMERARTARAEANRAKVEAVAASKVAEATIPLARQAFLEVQQALDEAVMSRKAGKGTLFYIQRELKEAEQFLPKGKFQAVKEAADKATKEATPP